MTFTELQTEVMARTRQTTTEASDRIGRAINDRYRRVMSTVGLGASARIEAITKFTLPSDPSVTFTDIMKVITLWVNNVSGTGTRAVLPQITYDQWRQLVPVQTATPVPADMPRGVPTCYAVAHMDAASVRVVVYPIPDTAYQIGADGIRNEVPPLSAAMIPAFAASFHDILMHGALADEWNQLKQDDLSTRSESMYEQRLSELRYFIAKSNCLAIAQGTRAFDSYSYRNPWYPWSWGA